ncbi:hypothetical protein [Streptomyces lutosisoli]|uniref:Uncharacterized protein n=1 Tax=Streptomyces lutosisoli TaxID=2665721 RepID=A0ABW2VLR5_9ACTN
MSVRTPVADESDGDGEGGSVEAAAVAVLSMAVVGVGVGAPKAVPPASGAMSVPIAMALTAPLRNRDDERVMGLLQAHEC